VADQDHRRHDRDCNGGPGYIARVIVDCALYRAGARVAVGDASGLSEVRSHATGAGDFVWVGLHDPTQDELDRVAAAFELHPLAVEDALKAHQRPKLDHYGESMFLTLKTLWYVDELDAVETGEVNLFVGPDFVVTVRHGTGAELATARGRLEEDASVLGHGPSAVVYAVCDRVVDGYEDVVASLEVDVDEVETSVFSPDRSNDSERIYTLKREIAEVRRAVLPLREPMRRFASGGVPIVESASAVFFRDVNDHLNRAAETVDGLDSLLSTAFDAQMAQLSVQQNEDMRKISAGAALVVVPTLIAGIYGMNFDRMPELHWDLGYGWALLLMLGTSLGLLWFFKRSGWL
jgi:magnesium transporter